MQKAFVPPEMLTMIEMETFLSMNIYLSGTENPGQIDSKMIDHFQFHQILPDRSQYPNCFSWYWSLVVFSPQTRKLWNPLNINPELSDIESENEVENSIKKPSENKSKNSQNNRHVYEIDVNGVDFLNGSNEDDFNNQFEGSFRMSHISNNKSASANSNIQDCQELVNGLENYKSIRTISYSSKNKVTNDENQNISSEDYLNQKKFFPSVDLNTKNQLKNKIKIIKSKIIPEKTSNQLKICELIVNSFEMTIQPQSDANPNIDSTKQLSEESTEIIRFKSNSQNNNRKKGNNQEIGIENNYSFFNKVDNLSVDKKFSLNIDKEIDNLTEKIKKNEDKNKTISGLEKIYQNEDKTIIKNIKSFCFPNKNRTEISYKTGSLDKTDVDVEIKDLAKLKLKNEQNKEDG